MSEMVERVAAVLRTYDVSGTVSRVLARAAIEAMREPTDSMARVGEAAVFASRMRTEKSLREFKARTGGVPTYVTYEASDGWRAMIDAALKDAP